MIAYISLQRFYWRAIMCLCFYNISPSSPTWYFHPAQQVRGFREKCKWDLNGLHRCYIIVSPSPPNGQKNKWTNSWVHGRSPVFCDLPSKSLCQACWAGNLSRRGELHSAGRENGLWVMRNGTYIFKTFLRLAQHDIFTQPSKSADFEKNENGL